MDESHAFADQVDEAVSLTFQTYERPKGKKPRGKKVFPLSQAPSPPTFFVPRPRPDLPTGAGHNRQPTTCTLTNKSLVRVANNIIVVVLP